MLEKSLRENNQVDLWRRRLDTVGLLAACSGEMPATPTNICEPLVLFGAPIDTANLKNDYKYDVKATLNH